MGQKYAVFDKQGFPKAFYDREIHGDAIPQEAIPISDEQWLEFINNQGRRKWDFEKKQVIPYEPQVSVSEMKQLVDALRKAKLRSLLSQTDYIFFKFQEAQISGDSELYNNLLEKYKGVLEYRKAIRKWNENIEKEIANATSLEDLQELKQKIEIYNP